MSIPPVAEELNTNEPQPTLNYQIPQQSSRRIDDGVGEANRRNEPTARVRGRIVRELIENDGVESSSFDMAERLGSEELERNYRLEKRLRREEADVDQKLKRLKEQLLIELRAQDNNSPLLPTSSPFVKRAQQETILKKFMIPTMETYDETENPRKHVLNYKIFMELQIHLNALMCKVFPTTLTRLAPTWFNSLELGSIKNFIDLTSVFINRFIAGVPAEKKKSYLETMQ